MKNMLSAWLKKFIKIIITGIIIHSFIFIFYYF